MKLRFRVSTIVGGLILSTAALGSFCQAAPMLDQSSIGKTASDVIAYFGGLTQQGQTFTVGITGVLKELDIFGAGTGPFFVDIRGQKDLHPDNDIVLATIAMNGFSGAASGLTVVPFNLQVTSGDNLSFVVYGPNAGPGRDTGDYVVGSTTAAYASGGIWAFGNPFLGDAGPSYWYANGNFGFPIDLQFQTFVDSSVASSVPEPATTALLGLGLIGFAASRRKLLFRAT